MEARVTLRPGQRGTKKLVQRFAESLICVRYRYDATRRKRFTTVELIVEETPWHPAVHCDAGDKSGDFAQQVAVRLSYSEQALREQVKAAGGAGTPAGPWDWQTESWRHDPDDYDFGNLLIALSTSI